MERILRRRELQSITGLSNTQIWKMEKIGLFPARRQISAGLVGWLESEVEAFLKSRPVAKATKP